MPAVRRVCLFQAHQTFQQHAKRTSGMAALLTQLCVVVCWLLNVPATCKCISGTAVVRVALLRQMVGVLGCLTSQQHTSVSQGRICSEKCTSCHAEIKAADLALYLTKSQHTDTGPTSPSANRIRPGACRGNHRNANF